MPASTVATIGAGTVVSYEDPNNAATYIDLCGVLSIGATGEKGEFVQIDPLCELTPEFISGRQTPEDKEITFKDVPGDSEQEAFIDLAKARETVNMRVTFSNGRVADFVVVLNGVQIPDVSVDEALTIVVSGKQSGATTWSMAA